MRYRRPKDSIASDMMWDAFQVSRSCYVDCSCGKTWKPGEEYNDLLEKGNLDGVPGFFFVEFNGMTLVQDCNGCNTELAKYENFIWSHRQVIRDYLSLRVDHEKKLADQEKLLNTIIGID